MAHLSEGTLRRMFDDPDARVGADAAHLETCGDCKANFKVIADDARAVATLLAVPEPRVDVDGAFARVMREPKAQPALGLRFPIVRPARRPALALVAALAAAAVVVVAFAAGGFFFQPTKVQAVPITLSDLQAVYESIFGRSFDKRNFRRRMLSQKIIRATGRSVSRGAHRPAELYEFSSRQPMLL